MRTIEVESGHVRSGEFKLSGEVIKIGQYNYRLKRA